MVHYLTWDLSYQYTPTHLYLIASGRPQGAFSHAQRQTQTCSPQCQSFHVYAAPTDLPGHSLSPWISLVLPVLVPAPLKECVVLPRDFPRISKATNYFSTPNHFDSCQTFLSACPPSALPGNYFIGLPFRVRVKISLFFAVTELIKYIQVP